MKNFFRITLVLSFLLLIAGIVVCLTDSKSNLNLLLVAALVLLAISFRGFSLLKGFSYTVLILAAVSIAMLYPSYFFSFGNFQLKKLIVPFVQLTMFGMGSHMSFEDFKGVVKMPKGVLVGVSCHFTIMPLVGFALSNVFSFPSEIAGGVILIGCVSSAMASNVMSYLSGANLALAVTIGACSTILSPVLTPFLMKGLAGQYILINTAHMMIDITNMIIIPIVAGFIFNLFFYGNVSGREKLTQLIVFAAIIVATDFAMCIIPGQGSSSFWGELANSMSWFYLLPMGVALLFRQVFRLSRQTVEQSLSLIAMLGILINTVIITASGRENLIQVGGLLILSCLLHNLTGFCVGYFAARLFGLPEKDRRTIAFEVGMQNGGVATGLALQMGKVATVGLASAIFGPLQNVTGSALANWFRSR